LLFRGLGRLACLHETEGSLHRAAGDQHGKPADQGGLSPQSLQLHGERVGCPGVILESKP